MKHILPLVLSFAFISFGAFAAESEKVAAESAASTSSDPAVKNDKGPNTEKPVCCQRAEAKGKTCQKPCCVAAAKEGKSCEKCLKKAHDKQIKKEKKQHKAMKEETPSTEENKEEPKS
jgi:hypothetical protein